jgi:hypothetical protein
LSASGDARPDTTTTSPFAAALTHLCTDHRALPHRERCSECQQPVDDFDKVIALDVGRHEDVAGLTLESQSRVFAVYW